MTLKEGNEGVAGGEGPRSLRARGYDHHASAVTLEQCWHNQELQGRCFNFQKRNLEDAINLYNDKIDIKFSKKGFLEQ